jgi:uncharacterized repeat protein (TIGR03803 family)
VAKLTVGVASSIKTSDEKPTTAIFPLRIAHHLLSLLSLGHKDASLMKTCFKCFPFPFLFIGVMLSVRVMAEDVALVYPYTYYEAGNQGGLLLWSNTIFATSWGSGIGFLGHVGTVFSVNIDGSNATELHKFDGSQGSGDGYTPYGGLVLSGDTLYGTTYMGGDFYNGTVFSVNTNGTGYTILRSFATSDGSAPSGSLVLSSNTLYGVARAGGSGGSGGSGTVFSLNADGSGFQVLHNFSPIISGTNDDGAYPVAALLLSGDTLYGTASEGGTGGAGTIFALNTNGSDFRTLHTFSPMDAITGTNTDGASPSGVLMLSGNTLYGTAMTGGVSSNGTVFKLDTQGNSFTVLHHFTAGTGRSPWFTPTNDDGAIPNGGLLLWNDTLYGTASQGGRSGTGTVFALGTDGTGFTVLHMFTDDTKAGWYPLGSLIRSDNTLYGTVQYGGPNNTAGAIFRLSVTVPPKLSIARSGANVILTWSADFAGYTLYSTTDLAAPNWTAVSPGPVVVNGLNTVTNPVSFDRQFFRLSH